MTDTAEYRRTDRSTDQQLALTAAATRSAAEFDGTHGPNVADERPTRDDLARRLPDDLPVPAA